MMDFLGFPGWLAGLGRTGVAVVRSASSIRKSIGLSKCGRAAPKTAPKICWLASIAARDEQTGGGMTAQEVRDHVITIFMAGHETTAMAMTLDLVSVVAASVRRDEIAFRIETVLGGRAPELGGSEQAHLHSNGDREESMRLVSAGAYHCARGARRRHACRAACAQGFRCADRPLGAPSPPAALAQSRTIRSRAASRRSNRRTSALLVPSLRGRRVVSASERRSRWPKRRFCLLRSRSTTDCGSCRGIPSSRKV